MSKPIYKAQEKPYQNDINDLIETGEIEKGRGPDKQKRKSRGSGSTENHDPKPVLQEGHTRTYSEVAAHRRMTAAWNKRQQVKKAGDPIYDAQERPYQDDINDLIEKGGPGSGIKGHMTNRPDAAAKPKNQLADMEKEYKKLYNIAEDFASSSDPEVRESAKAYRKKANALEEKVESLKDGGSGKFKAGETVWIKQDGGSSKATVISSNGKTTKVKDSVFGMTHEIPNESLSKK